MTLARRGSDVSLPGEYQGPAASLAGHAQEKVALVDTDFFNYGMGCVVVFNVVMVGLETEYNDDTVLIFDVVSNGFILVYVIELLMRGLSHGIKALRDPFVCIDAIVILLTFLGRVISSKAITRALPPFRMLRMLNLLRKSKYFRLDKELRSITNSSVKMLKTLFWVSLFLIMCLWIMAIFAHIVIGQSAKWNGTTDPTKEWPPFESFDSQEYFGTQWRSFFTLFQIVTLAQWSPHVARPVIKVYPLLFLFFWLFLFITTYGLLITIVSNLVQESLQTAKVSAQAAKDNAREIRRRSGLKIRDILREVDTDGSGELSEKELEAALVGSRLRSTLLDLGVPVLDAESLIRLLDKTGDGQVSFEELVEGAVRMDEELKPSDYAMLGFWMKSLLNRTQHLEERLEILCSQISFIRARVTGSFAALKHLATSAKDSQLRNRALHVIRTQGLQLPPELEKPKPKPKGLAYSKAPREEFEIFTRRFLGDSPDVNAINRLKARRTRSTSPDESSSAEPLRTLALFKNTMPPAPAVEDPRRPTIPEQERWATDRYGLVKIHHENPRLKALKQEIAGTTSTRF